MTATPQNVPSRYFYCCQLLTPSASCATRLRFSLLRVEVHSLYRQVEQFWLFSDFVERRLLGGLWWCGRLIDGIQLVV